jgi:LytS/YehU family sensor histidine kinase
LVAYIGDYIRTKQLQTKLLQSKSEADLHALKAQINPHFLFNVLNTVYNQASLEESPNTADMILKISDLLRFSIEEAPKNKIPLEKKSLFYRIILIYKKLGFHKIQ